MKLARIILENPRIIPHLNTEDDLDICSINKAKYTELLKIEKTIYKIKIMYLFVSICNYCNLQVI